MRNDIHNANILYVNRFENKVLVDGEILETHVAKSKKDSPRDTIFDIFARILVKNKEQRKVLYHVMFDKEDYTNKKLCDKLQLLYGKSARTYQRAIDYLCSIRIIKHNRYKVLKVNADYDLSLLDLDNFKSIIIHIDQIMVNLKKGEGKDFEPKDKVKPKK